MRRPAGAAGGRPSVAASDDDESFGTTNRQPVGGRWRVEEARAREDLASSSDGMRAASFAGDVWLERTERVGDVDCLDLRSRIVLDGIDVPKAPAGTVVDVARATASFWATVPVDTSLGRVGDRTVMGADDEDPHADAGRRRHGRARRRRAPRRALRPRRHGASK